MLLISEASNLIVNAFVFDWVVISNAIQKNLLSTAHRLLPDFLRYTDLQKATTYSKIVCLGRILWIFIAHRITFVRDSCFLAHERVYEGKFDYRSNSAFNGGRRIGLLQKHL